ncbi:hypothetical protein [Brucella intermedia]|uniref:hypothetical protein n=1 Tax=Brucella intermedia TaxID=94625 RepID=UPI0005867DB1|nr:hypothetical protein [Brucella intermedia]SUA82054.1 Uncharacterised protein [Brucella intermedia]
MASEDLLKKAVAAFNALSPEQQAEMLEEQRQSWVRGNVGLSRDERGMTSPVMPRPAPAAPVDGLERYRPEPMSLGGMVRDPDGGYVTRSQAEELLAAERAEKEIAERNRDAARENFLTMQKTAAKLLERAEKAEADNAAQAARIKELDRCHEGTIDLCNQKTAQIEALEAKLAAAIPPSGEGA